MEKEIPKPDGGVRLPVIPAVLDRFIQQAISQIVEQVWDSLQDAMLCGNARKKYWHMSKIKWVAIAMPENYFIAKGLYLPGN